MRHQRQSLSPPPRQSGAAARRLLRWASLSALILSIAPPAFAYCSGDVDWLKFPQLSVTSNGTQYTGVTPIGSGWEGRVDIECEGLARVKSWSLYPILYVEGLDSLSFESYKGGKSYPWGKRPQNVHRTVGTIFPDVFVDDYAAAACNLNLERLMSQGQSRAQVLSEQRVVTAYFGGRLDVDITVGDPFIQARPNTEVDIICEKSPAKGVKPGVTGVTTTADFELDNAKLTIYPYTYIGACPKVLTLFMEVQGSHAGTFEAGVESTAGWKSTKVVLQTNELDDKSGLWSREFSDPFTVPVQQPKPGGGSGAVGQQASGNFQFEPTPDDGYEPPTSGPLGAAGGFAPADPGSNVHQEALRLFATANGKTVYSPWQQYSVTCDPKPALEPATQVLLPGGTGPKPPKPGKPAGVNPTPGSPTPGKPAPQADQKSKPPTLQVDQGAKQPERGDRAPSSAKSQASPPAPTSKPPVKSKPELEPTKERKESAQPDLRVVRARRNARNEKVIEFLVANDGKAVAAKSSARLTCARADGGFESWSASVPSVQASSQVWVESSPKQARTVRTRVRGCEIRLDETHEVKETNEGNNVFSCVECTTSPASKR